MESEYTDIESGSTDMVVDEELPASPVIGSVTSVDSDGLPGSPISLPVSPVISHLSLEILSPSSLPPPPASSLDAFESVSLSPSSSSHSSDKDQDDLSAGSSLPPLPKSMPLDSHTPPPQNFPYPKHFPPSQIPGWPYMYVTLLPSFTT